ncbi:MAG: TauD/TfdA family dioxygenase, partial [Acidobacteriota bacterium]|nr:TauD/TfdA family dioxygenase [Acidobacteriota bacterium]
CRPVRVTSQVEPAGTVRPSTGVIKKVMKARSLNRKSLPLVVGPEGGAGPTAETLFALCRARGDELRARLLECGALLLSGFPPLGADGFARFVREFSGREPLDYVGGASPRVKLGGGLYTSTEYPSRYSLSLHNELSYTYRWPAHLYFYCETAPAAGGETPLGDSRSILGNLDGEVVGRFKSKGVKYVRNLGGAAGAGYSWQEAFETEERAEVEAYCRAGGIQMEWGADGGLRLSEVRPATARHPSTGEEVWFNQAEGFHPSALDAEDYGALTAAAGEEGLRLNAFYGDGSPLDPASLAHVRAVTRAEMVLVPWQTGDILVLDNLLACHGRMPFKGPRRILLAMT